MKFISLHPVLRATPPTLADILFAKASHANIKVVYISRFQLREMSEPINTVLIKYK